MAVAVFRTPKVDGEVLFTNTPKGVRVVAVFTKLPSGEHGFHIHKAGDLRGEGCKGACEHFSIDPHAQHGGAPGSGGERHTGDLGNISCNGGVCEKSYYLSGITVEDLWGRSLIVHADPDDLGKGPFEDSTTTGHSGKRIACAIIGRTSFCK
jgi:Cu-Zn family superoxide dismutase